MVPIAAVTSVQFFDGQEIPLPAPGVTVIVGSNNVGKTFCLREIAASLGIGGAFQRRMMSKVANALRATEDEAIAWLRTRGRPDPRDPNVFALPGNRFTEAAFLQAIRQGDSVAQYIAVNLELEKRMEAYAPTQLYDVLSASPSAPLHHLYADPNLERDVSTLAQQNFGVPLTLNRLGNHLELHVGATSEEPFLNNLPNREYINAINNMPPLSQQGHGMRSFVGLYLTLATQAYQIVIVDEPEAFLHPPQARSIGFEIARLADEREMQVILATHSLDLMKGVLDYNPSNTLVIRLGREGNTTSVAHLNAELINELWADPLLRYSGVLDGLFYRLTILCESDPDCRFFSAVGATMSHSDGLTHTSEVNFVPVGGKARFATALKALRALDVPTRVLADFDLVKEKADLEKLVAAAGGEWPTLERNWTAGIKPIADSGVGVPCESLLEKITKILSEAGPRLTPKAKKDIVAELITNDAWKAVKRAGLASVPPADPRQATERLLAQLNTLGIFPSPHGELESLVPQVAGHGPAWLARVLEQGFHESCTTAKSFLASVLAVDT